MTHTCHARGCHEHVPPRMLMCMPHWRKVPSLLKRVVWDNYVAGQENRKDPTRSYLDAADAAIKAVFFKERGKQKKEQKAREAARQGTLF